ncbi:MAG: signal peptidase II [Psychrobium sp.]
MLKSVDSTNSKPALAQSGLVWLWLAIVSLVVDQATKLYVLANFKLHESVDVMPFFNFTYAQNRGAAFSFLSEAGGWQRWFFTIIAVSVSGLLIYWMRGLHKSTKGLNIAYALVLSGAIGNLIDRLSYGFVVDFLHLYYEEHSWPVFNIADVAICVGAFLIIIDAFINKDDNESEKGSK